MPTKNYNRRLTNIERLFTYSPLSIVALVARIKGEVSRDQFQSSISRIRERDPLLRSKILDKGNGDRWFTSEQVGEIPVEIVQRKSDQQWKEVIETCSKIPFDFDKRPPILFILLQSSDVSEIIILCHHIICDGLSLAYLARDLMHCLGDPNYDLEDLPDPMPINEKNLPSDVKLNGLVKYIIKRMNRKWEAEKIIFNKEDYLALNEAYWKNFHHMVISIELSETETTDFVQRCKNEHVTVNAALTSIFLEAQETVRGSRSSHSLLGIAANLRNRISEEVGERMGFYAGVVKMKYKYDNRKNIWDNARKFHRKFKSKLNNKNLFSDFVSWLVLDPTIIEAINFKKVGSLIKTDSEVGKRLYDFSQRKDVVLSILKRDKMDSFEHKIMGTAVTNLTKLDFPRKYGHVELDRMIIHPGGAFPLVNVNMVVGVVTCSGKMSIIMEYAEEAVDTKTMEKVKERVMEHF